MGGPQDFVMYHGAPFCGCAGSLMSLADCAWMLTAYSAMRTAWMNTDSSGWKTCMMNMMPFTSSKNTESTAMTTLKFVMNWLHGSGVGIGR